MPPSTLTRSDWVKQLCSVQTAEGRRELFERIPVWHDADTLHAIHAELISCLYSDRARARKLAELASWIADARAGDFILAMSLRCQGHIHSAEASYDAAVSTYRRALTLLEKNVPEAGQICFAGLPPLIHLGHFDEAHRWAARARTIFEHHKDFSSLALLDIAVGNIFSRQDRHQEAIQCYRRTLPQLLEDPEGYATTLCNSAHCYAGAGNFSEALSQYHAMHDWCVRYKLSALVPQACYHVAHLHYLRGEYPRALQLYPSTRRLSEEAGDLHHAALCDLDQSEILLDLNLLFEARKLAEQAAAAFEDLGLTHDRARATLNCAVVALRLGDSETANKSFHQARKWFAHENNRYLRAILDLYQALVCERANSSADARRYAEQALLVLSHSPLTGQTAFCHSLLAHLSIAEGKLASAAAQLRELEAKAYSPALRCQLYYLRGKLHEQSGELEMALKDYLSAIHEIEETRRAAWLDELKVPFPADKNVIYQAAIRLSANLPDAFSLVRRAKSKNIPDKLYAEPADERLAAGRRDVTANYRQLEILATSLRCPKVETVRELRQRILEGERRLSKFAETRPAAGLELAEGAALVEFFPVNGELHVWVAIQNALHHAACAPIEQIKQSARLLQLQLSGRTQESENAARVHLRELYVALINPILEFLPCAAIVISPFAFLHNVPFGRLLDTGGHALSEKYVVSCGATVGALPVPEVPTKHSSFSLGDYSIRLRTEQDPGTIKTTLAAQIVNQRHPTQPLANLAVALIADKRVLQRSFSNNLGEFVIEFVKRPHLRLRFDLPAEDRPLEVSLKESLAA